MLTSYLPLCVSWLLFFGLLYQQKSEKSPLPELNPQARFWTWLCLGLTLRLSVLWNDGFHYDIGTYKAWALTLSDPQAPWDIYKEGYFADYPPFFMYILYIIGSVSRIFDLGGSAHFTALIKFPALLADLATAAILLRHCQSSSSQQLRKHAWLIASLVWFNPAFVLDSALWGQTDSILCMFMAYAWTAWQKHHLGRMSAALGIALAFKPQAIIFIYAIGLCLLGLYKPRQILRATLIGLSSFGLTVLPFAVHEKASWLPDLYLATANTYAYMTVNAYNLWALLGMNWKQSETIFFVFSLHHLAMASCLLGVAYVSWRCLQGMRSNEDRFWQHSAWLMALAGILFFMLAPRMHERYLLVALPFLAIAACNQGRWLFLWTGLSFANVLTVYHYYIALDQAAPANSNSVFAISLTACLALIFSWAYWHAPKAVDALSTKFGQFLRLPQHQPERQRWSSTQTKSVLLLFFAALLLGCFRLGSMNYPTSGLVTDELSVDLKFAEAQLIRRMVVHIGEGSAEIRLNAIGAEQTVPLGEWHTLNSFHKRYELFLPAHIPTQNFQLDIRNGPIRINEVAFLDGKRAVATATDIKLGTESGLKGEIGSLIDEKPAPLKYGLYYVDPYFDEIYHGRTAYEFVHDLPVYETTHPPLGKYILSKGIEVFGMTPFGMRFMSTVASAALVAVLAWAAWLLVGTQQALIIAGLLGLFEFSRYSIGRYATIDAFVMLFVLSSAALLWRSYVACQATHWSNLWRPSAPLALAGLCLGCAIASKWSSLYFGAGVFVLFLISVAYRNAKRGKQFESSLPNLLLGASLCFGLIPLAVYLLSYIPFLESHSSNPSLFSIEGLKTVARAQYDMYDYHAKLDAEHPFSSAWYSWPFMWNPLWLYKDDLLTGLRSSITLMGNPAIWLGGLLACLHLAFNKHAAGAGERVLILGSAVTLYLPWILIERVSFIYHYYPIVPFLILALTVTLARLPHSQYWRYVATVLTTIAGLLFLLFYPAISGFPVDPKWSEFLRWLPTWWML